MLFSVAIPAYKHKFLSEAILSVLNQSYRDFELIIVNDASPEDLDEVVIQFTDPRIRYYKNKRNCGALNVVDNWNKCLSYALGDYIICMGDDDRLLSNCLEDYAKLITQYPNVDVLHTCTEIIDEEGNFKEIQIPRPEFESALSLLYNRWDNRYRQFIGDFCFKVKPLRNNDGFFKLPLAWGSDDITAVRAALFKGIANTSVPGFQYRVSGLTITNSGSALIKIKANNLSKEWYLNLFQSFERVELTRLDSRYLELSRKLIDSHYRIETNNYIIDDLSVSLSHVFFWIKEGNKYGFSRFRILAICYYVIKERIKRFIKH
jgi:glycosyltransferase involved in cell wall biosynthesis